MNTIIRTAQQLTQAQNDAWVYGMIVAAVALALAVAIAFMISWRSDRKDYIIRRIWFIVIGLALPVLNWFYNLQIIVPKIQNPGFQSMFRQTNLYVLLAAIAVYAIVGVILMFAFRNSKFGSILGKKKN